MNLRMFATVGDFLSAVGPTLYANEAENSLLLGVAQRLADGHRYGAEAPFFACVEADGELPVIALRTPPYNLLLCAERAHAGALALLCGGLADAGTKLPGVHGRVDVATSFAAMWTAKVGAKAEAGMGQRLYRLDRVSAPSGVAGRARWAVETDTGLLAAWAESFIDEAVPNDPKHDVRGMIERSVAAQGLLAWEDGETVSMCARTRPTAHSASISLVYTPPAFRGRGYASACVAELSQRILDSGKAYCTLFTDLANPTSNAIYQQIGYRPLGDFREVRFEPPT